MLQLANCTQQQVQLQQSRLHKLGHSLSFRGFHFCDGTVSLIVTHSAQHGGRGNLGTDRHAGHFCNLRLTHCAVGPTCTSAPMHCRPPLYPPTAKHLAMCMLIVKNHTRATARSSCAHALPWPQTPQSFRHPPLTQCSASLPHQKFPLQHCSLQWKPPYIGPQRPPRSARGALSVRLRILGCCKFAPRGAQTATCKVATKQCNGRRAQTKDHQHQQCLALLFLGHLLARLAGPYYYGPCAVAAS